MVQFSPAVLDALNRLSGVHLIVLARARHHFHSPPVWSGRTHSSRGMTRLANTWVHLSGLIIANPHRRGPPAAEMKGWVRLGLAILVLRVVYVTCVITLTLYTCGQLYLLSLYFWHHILGFQRKQKPSFIEPTLKDWPRVTVQLPLYNERYVARRIVEAAAALDYPRDRLHIQVLDDSTDDTTELIQGRIAQLQDDGICIDLIHRVNRAGYKAGALANGMKYTNGEIIAIFDADFVPAPDFLRRTVPYFVSDERLGVVQTRWGHLNRNDNLLTQSQALAIDAHFAVEQVARSQGNLIFTFSGTCGLWRRTCIEDAGGWQSDTITEDFDLSYRAHLKGWNFHYVRDIVVPGEIPPQMAAYKQQQARWAKGSTQVLLKLGKSVALSNLGLRKRVMGIMQLFQYTIHLVMLLTLLLSPIMLLTHSIAELSLAPLGLLGMGAPMLIVFGQQTLHRDWLRRSLYFPLLMTFSSGLMFNNSKACISALLGRQSEFVRTPKFHLNGRTDRWRRSQYQPSLLTKDMGWEVLLGLYALVGAGIAYQVAPTFIPYFMLYATAFFSVAALSFADRISVQRRPVRNRKSRAAEPEVVGQPGR